MELYVQSADPRVFPLRGKTVTGAKVRERTSRPTAVAVRLLVTVTTVLTVGGFASLILLGPANVRGLAEGRFDRAVHRIGTRAPEGIPQDFLLALRRGIVASTEGRNVEALTALTEAINASTNANTLETLGVRASNSLLPETHLWRLDIQAHMARAEILRRLARYGDALQDLDMALRLNNRHYENREVRGIMLMVLGRSDDAIADFDILLAMRESAEVVFARGLANYLKDNWAAATVDFARASETSPRNRKYAAWLADTKVRTQAHPDVEALHADRIFGTIYARGAREGTLPPGIGDQMPSGSAAQK